MSRLRSPSKRAAVPRVVLYAGGQTRRNARLHEAVIALAKRGPARGRRGVRMTYLPFTAEGVGPYFRRFERRFRAFGASRFDCVPADLPELARESAARGGVLAGVSAGAHLLTPDIRLAGYPPFDRDENEVGLPRPALGAVGLVELEFFPHYRHSPRYRRALAAWARREGRPLYAARDGSGLVIEGDRLTPVGDVWRFDPGVESRVGSWARPSAESPGRRIASR